VLRCCSPPHVHPASEYVSGLTEGRPSASDYLVKPLWPNLAIEDGGVPRRGRGAAALSWRLVRGPYEINTASGALLDLADVAA
jgi:hypothetical protein